MEIGAARDSQRQSGVWTALSTPERPCAVVARSAAREVEIVCEVPNEIRPLGPTIGVDLGVNTVMAATDGKKAIAISGREIKATIQLRNKQLAEIVSKQAKKVKRSRRHKRLQRAKYRVLKHAKNKVRDLCHKATRKVADAFPNAKAYVGESFNDACRKMGRKQAQTVSSACNRKVVNLLNSKLAACIEVEEAYSSQTCPVCGERSQQRRIYRCPKCGPFDLTGVFSPGADQLPMHDGGGREAGEPAGHGRRLGHGGLWSDHLCVLDARRARGVRRGEGCLQCLGRGLAERGIRVDHHRPVRIPCVYVFTSLVVVLADPKSEHELVGDVVGDDPFKLIKRLSGLRFLVDEAETAGPNLRHSDDPWGCITGGIGDQAKCVGGRVGRVQGQRDWNSALLECLLDPLHDNVLEGGHLLRRSVDRQRS